VVAKKFVINDGDLILGQVELHEELVRGRDRSKTVGGGRWHVDDLDPNTIYFYGSSIAFGKVTRQEFEESFKQPSLESMNVIFTEHEYLSEYLKEQQNKK
jgi:hypothetical protein